MSCVPSCRDTGHTCDLEAETRQTKYTGVQKERPFPLSAGDTLVQAWNDTPRRGERSGWSHCRQHWALHALVSHIAYFLLSRTFSILCFDFSFYDILMMLFHKLKLQ